MTARAEDTSKMSRPIMRSVLDAQLWSRCILLLFASLFPFVCADIYLDMTLQYDGSTVTLVASDPVWSWSGPITDSSTSHHVTVGENSVTNFITTVRQTLYRYPLRAEFHQLPAIVVNSTGRIYNGTEADWLDAISARVWRIAHADDIPYGRYVSSEVMCDVSSVSSLRPFQCLPAAYNSTRYNVSDVSTYPAFRVNVSHALASYVPLAIPINISLSISSVLPVSLSTMWVNDMLQVAVHRVRLLSAQANETMQLRSDVIDRHETARISVFFLWAFIGATVFVLLCIASVWQTWLCPLVPRFPSVFWMLLWCSAMVPLCAYIGLAGFLILAFLAVAYCVLVAIVYGCLRIKYRDPTLEATLNENERMAAMYRRQRRMEANRDVDTESGKLLKERHSHSTRTTTSAPFDPLVIAPNGPDIRSIRVTAAAATVVPLSPSSDGANSSSPYPERRASVTMRVVQHQTVTATASNRCPSPLGRWQRYWLVGLSVSFLTLAVVCTAIFGLWSVDDYRLWARRPMAVTVSSDVIPSIYLTAFGHQYAVQQGPVLELIPQTIAKSVNLVYAFDGYARALQMNNVFFSVSTDWCGEHYSTLLTDDDSKYRSLYRDFIVTYQIDMSTFAQPDYRSYSSVNDFFTRSLRPGARPIAAPGDESILLSPCDGRVMAFAHTTTDSLVWIKEADYSLRELIGPLGYSSAYDGGSMAILRLAPQDYHRFHAPVTARLNATYRIEGTFHSINQDGMTSKNYAIYNQRTVMLLDTEHFGRIAYIAIGALCVGSVELLVDVGSSVQRGAELGHFQFGGSTVVLVLERNRIRFEDDLLLHASNRVEVQVETNARMGYATKRWPQLWQPPARHGDTSTPTDN